MDTQTMKNIALAVFWIMFLWSWVFVILPKYKGKYSVKMISAWLAASIIFSAFFAVVALLVCFTFKLIGA